MTSVPMPGMVSESLLVDGALLASAPGWRSMRERGVGIPLYEDLGDEARSVGPWLAPVDALQHLADSPLPVRLGISVLRCATTQAGLVEHFRRIRYVACSDDQRFFLRYADSRALGAMQAAWPPGLLACIKGPVASWTWTDRSGRPAEFCRGLAGTSTPLPPVTPDQLDALVAAGEADQMAASLEELHDADVRPVHDAAQFDLVARALDWCRRHRLEPWLLKRSVCCQFVRTAALVADDPAFLAAARRSAGSGDAAQIDGWASSVAGQASRRY